MFHPIQTWLNRHLSHPLTRMHDRFALRQNDASSAEQRPTRPAPVDVSWMPMPRSHARNDHNQGR